MKEGRGGYVPPAYVPFGGLDQPDSERDKDEDRARVGISRTRKTKVENHDHGVPHQWSSGICACCDDVESCFIGLACPCFLYGKNAEFLGSGTFLGSCMTHFILWSLVNTICCFLTDGVLLGFPGCIVSCYACGYRRALRSKYNLPVFFLIILTKLQMFQILCRFSRIIGEAPCGDFVTHFFCHLCATCQEFREIRERSGGSTSGLDLVEITAPQCQTMESFTSN